MSFDDAIYREIITDHTRDPHHKGRVDPADFVVHDYNPLCGDEVEVSGRIADDRLVEIAFAGRGCSISQSAASMMTDVVEGADLERVDAIVDSFKAFMMGKGEPEIPIEDLGDLEALGGVKKYPVRIKCALIGWNTLAKGLLEYRRNQTRETSPKAD